MFQALSKTGVGISSLEAYVWFKWGTVDKVELDIPLWAHPEYEVFRETSLPSWTQTVQGNGVLKEPLAHLQVAKGEEKESGLGVLTPEFKWLFSFILLKIDCVRGHFAFLPANRLLWHRLNMLAEGNGCNWSKFCHAKFLVCGPLSPWTTFVSSLRLGCLTY